MADLAILSHRNPNPEHPILSFIGVDDYNCPCTSARSAGERRVVAVVIGAINRSTASAVRAASLCAPQTHRVRTGTLADSVGSNGLYPIAGVPFDSDCIKELE